MLPVLDQLIVDTRLEVRGRSLRSAVSGLRAWQRYAVPILGYPEPATLPPRSSRDVQRYVMICSDADIAANYISYSVYGCRLCELSLAWRDVAVSMFLKGLSKRLCRETARILKTRFLLDDELIRNL